MDWAVTFGQALLVGLLAGWLVLGALENIRAPAVNYELVRDIMNMRYVREKYPEIYQHVSGNRIDDEGLARLLFRLIVVFETTVAVALTISSLWLLGAAMGILATENARIAAILSVTGFTAIWGGFLVGGQWFHYWAGAEGTQATHYMMTLWGVATFIALT